MLTGELLVQLAYLILVAYVSGFLHELGHAVMARRMGLSVGAFGMGTARPYWTGDWRGMKVFFCRVRPFQGITFIHTPQIFPTARQWAWALAGGVIAHALLVAAAGLLWLAAPSLQFLWLTLLVSNAIFFIINLVPVTFQIGQVPMRNDGAMIVQAFRTGSIEAPVPARLQIVPAFRSLWEATGDVRSLHLYLVAAAGAYVEVGDGERAAALCAEVEALPQPVPPWATGLAAMVRGSAAILAGHFEEATAELDQADALYAGLDHAAGAFLVEQSRADLLLKQGDTAGALVILDRLQTHRFASRLLTLRAALLVGRLCAHATAGDRPAAEALLREYEALNPTVRTPSRDLQAYAALARVAERQEDWPAAAQAYDRVLASATRIYESLPDAEDRQRYAERNASLLTATEAAYAQLGLPPPREQLDAVFPTPEVLAHRQQGEREARNRRRNRIGLTIALVDALVGGGMLGGAVAYALWNAPPTLSLVTITTGVLGAFLLACAVLTCLYALALYGLGRLVPKLRGRGGQFTVGLACFPWFVCVLVVTLQILEPPRNRERPLDRSLAAPTMARTPDYRSRNRSVEVIASAAERR